jgi:anti-anti-sigma regulatory factor
VTAPFSVELRRFEGGNGPLRIVCEGKIDILVKERLQGVVQEALRQTPPSGILIDLSAVESIDAAGLESLMAALLHLDGQQAVWSVTASPAARGLLELVGIGRLSSGTGGGWLATGGYGGA